MFGLAKRAELLAVISRLEQVEKRLDEPVEVSSPDLVPLESRLARVEQESGTRHLQSLELMEKIARRLDWRQRKRVDPEDEVEVAGKDSPPNDGAAEPPGVPPDSSHLARRFKGW